MNRGTVPQLQSFCLEPPAHPKTHFSALPSPPPVALPSASEGSVREAAKKQSPFCALLLAFGALLAQAQITPPAVHAAPPSLSFTASEVTMTAAQAGKIVYFGIAREFYDDGVTVTPYSGIGEAKAGEIVVVTPRRGVSPSAIWAGIDLATGEVSISYPDGDTPDLTIAGNPKAGLQKLEVQTDYLYLLLVRPGVGAWISKAGDGGPSDEDGEGNGTLAARLSGMAPVATSPAVPLTIAANDVVLGINPNTFAVFAAGVTE